MNKVIIQKEQDLQSLAKKLLPKLKHQNLLCLYGDLGSGKTTFVRYLCDELQVANKVKSPSYVICNTYHAKDYDIYHLDFYRLEGQDPYTAVDLQELLSAPSSIVIIEWADLVEDYLPKERLELHFKNLGGTRRQLTINN